MAVFLYANVYINMRKNKMLTGVAFIIVIIAGIYLYSRYNPEEYLIFPKCPVYTITGYQCPGCGSQRAFHNLFHGNILTAFMYNPLMILLVPYVMFGVFIEYIANRDNTRIINLRNIFFGKWAILVLAMIFVIYTILRNIYFWLLLLRFMFFSNKCFVCIVGIKY